jgi:hypothetical protein
MELIKEYLNELKNLKADEISGRSVSDISNSFYARARDNKLGDEAELENLLNFARDMNATAYAYGRSKEKNTALVDEIGYLYYNFKNATQQELRIKMAEIFKEVFKL